MMVFEVYTRRQGITLYKKVHKWTIANEMEKSGSVDL